MAVCLAVNLAFNMTLTPHIGLTGPGWALGAGYLAYLAYVVAALSLRRMHRKRMAELG
jgi:O-antigen/teichoic acid export membrane protein